MRSNCHWEAWKAWRRGEAIGICLHATQYAKLANVMRHPLLRNLPL